MWDEPLYETMKPTTSSERVLVAVVPRVSDWELVCQEHWYRIPVAHAPQRLGADYLAFYHTGAFGEGRWSISYYAPICSYRLARRRDLIPQEPEHPRADALYYRVELGTLQELQHPIPSAKLRRVTFIMTTLTRLLQAQEINDLWDRESARNRLLRALQMREIAAYPNYEIRQGSLHYVADLAIPCSRRGLLIDCGPSDEPVLRETPATQGAPALCGWTTLHWAAGLIMADLPTCVEQVRIFVRENGGQPGAGNPPTA